MEPKAVLDATTVSRLLELAARLEETTRSLTLLAHDLEVCECDRLAQVDDGFAATARANLRMALAKAAAT